MSDASALQMLQFDLSTPHLMRIAKQRRFPIRQSDSGYLVHCLMRELFGSSTVTPFSVRGDSRRSTTVLAYSDADLDTLHEHAQTFAEPAIYEACDWQSLSGKPLPSVWPEGKTLAFETRVCPGQAHELCVGEAPQGRRSGRLPGSLLGCGRRGRRPRSRIHQLAPRGVRQAWWGGVARGADGPLPPLAASAAYARRAASRAHAGAPRCTDARHAPDHEFRGIRLASGPGPRKAPCVRLRDAAPQAGVAPCSKEDLGSRRPRSPRRIVTV